MVCSGFAKSFVCVYACVCASACVCVCVPVCVCVWVCAHAYYIRRHAQCNQYSQLSNQVYLGHDTLILSSFFKYTQGEKDDLS